MKLKWLVALLASMITLTGSAKGPVETDGPGSAAPMQPDMGCTVVYATDGEVAMGGNNEDYGIPFTEIRFIPAQEGQYGRVYFGYENFIWSGGMNDQGLFFDAMAVDQPVQVPREGKPIYEATLSGKALAECATVDCVVELHNQYHTYDTWYFQFLFGDAQGSSVIIEPLSILRNDGGYQVGTNFYQSMTPVGQRTCPRYRTATGLLKNADAVSVELMRTVMDATHLEGQSTTLYSNVYDLTNRLVYVYYFHDYENVVVFDLEEELLKGAQTIALPTLFPSNPEAERWAAPIVAELEAKRAGRTVVDVDPDVLQSYVGRYDIPDDMRSSYPYAFIGVALDGDALVLQIKTDKGWYPLTPQSENEFFHLSVRNDFAVSFERDASGSIEHMLYREGGREYVLPPMAAEPAADPTATAPATAASATAVSQMGETGGSRGGTALGAALGLFAFGAWMVWRGFRRRANVRA